eukprot:SAG22_NODE_548_length_9247_cov_14.468080_3_plen_342_part_00
MTLKDEDATAMRDPNRDSTRSDISQADVIDIGPPLLEQVPPALVEEARGSVHSRTESFNDEVPDASPVKRFARLSINNAAAGDKALDTIDGSPSSGRSAGGGGVQEADNAFGMPAEQPAPPPKPVPCVIIWRHPGTNVYLTGDFNGWSAQALLMQRDGNEFWAVLNLLPGIYHYKFVVDGEWMYAPDHATTKDARGNMSNNIRVEPFESTIEDDLVYPDSPRESYSQRRPSDADMYAKDAPLCPPLLSAPVLLENMDAPEPGAGPIASASAPLTAPGKHHDPAELKVPPHVVINHLYNANGVSAGGGRVGGPGCNVLSVTVRYKDGKYGDKFTSQVFYTAA